MGADSASVTLYINDKPSPPTNCHVENVLEGAVLLAWKPPVNDASGEPTYISEYQVERRELPNDIWIRAGVARYKSGRDSV